MSKYFLTLSLVKGLIIISISAIKGQQAPALNPFQREADSLFFNRNYASAAAKYADLLKQNPNAPVAALARWAFSNHFAGKYDQALQQYEHLQTKQLPPPLKSQLFSRMAMTYAMTNAPSKALTYLDSADANGYANPYEMEHFKDFDNIRQTPQFKALYDKIYARAYPCRTTPEARQFDFWIGEWEVYNNAYPNHRVGSSLIENVSGDCAILENWQAFNNANSGKSQNWYDPKTQKWTQLWIGSAGGAIYFTDGEYRDGAMRFKFTQPDAKGTLQPGNFIFYNLGPNKVRQYNEVSNDGGKTFQVSYDLLYIRKGTKG